MRGLTPSTIREIKARLMSKKNVLKITIIVLGMIIGWWCAELSGLNEPMVTLTKIIAAAMIFLPGFIDPMVIAHEIYWGDRTDKSSCRSSLLASLFSSWINFAVGLIVGFVVISFLEYHFKGFNSK